MGLGSCERALRSAALAMAALALGALASPASAQFTCATASPVSVGAVLNGSNAGSPGDGLAGLCANTTSAVWHSFTPAVSGNHTISLCGSSINTVATLYAACGSTPLACDDNTCGTGSVIVFPLTAGTTYRVRVASANTTPGGAYTLLISAPAVTAPSNNNCGAATALTLNVPLRSTNLGSNGSDQTLCGVLDTTDVWFSFNPLVTGTHRAELCAGGFAPVLSVHTGCIGGNSSVCNTESTSFTPCQGAIAAGLTFNAVAGRPVLLRVAGQRGSFGSFDIAVYGPRTNDVCTNPVPLQTGQVVNGSTSPVLSSDVAVDCAPSGADAWHSFVPAETGMHEISLCGSGFDTVLSVHSLCPTAPGSAVLACNDDACSTQSRIMTSLLGGVQYFIRVAGKGSSPTWGNFTLSVNRIAPNNDICTSATPVSLGTPIIGTTIGSSGTDQTPSCGTGDTKDVWYSFTPAVTTSYEIHTCGSVMDTTLAVFNSCATNPLVCNDNDPGFCGGNSSNSRLTTVLNAGFTSLIRVSGVAGTEGQFTLSIARTPPPNDSCAAASVLPPGATINGTVSGAAGSGLSTCISPDAPDVWYDFTPPATAFWRVDTCDSVLVGTVSIYSACPPSDLLACGGSGFASCPSGRGAAVTAYLNAGTAYRVRVAHQQGATTGGAFQIIATPVAPPNDDCADAQDIPAITTPVFGATVGAASSTPLAPCATGDTRDVWFRFTPALTGTYQIDTCITGGSLDTVLTVHEQCGGNAIACSDDQFGCDAGGSRVALRLLAGVPYLVRISGKNSTEGTFFASVTIAPPVNDSCASAQAISLGDTPFDTLGASTDGVFIDLTCSAGFNLVSNDVWFLFTAPSSGSVTATLCGSTFDTVIAVSAAGPGCPTGLYPVVGCNDDFPCVTGSSLPSPQSQVSWSAGAGVPYFIRVGSRLGDTGSGTLRLFRPNTCPCDWNASGDVNIQDVFDFVSAWFSGAGDFTGDTRTTLQDVLEFLNCWLTPPAGC